MAETLRSDARKRSSLKCSSKGPRLRPSSNVQPTVPLESPTQPLAPPAVSEPVESAIPTVQIAQSVIHHHLLGSCTGRLKIDGEKISFWSSGNPRDSFTRKIKQINNFSLDDKLLIEFKDKVYRFEALARDAKDNRERLDALLRADQAAKDPSAEKSVMQESCNLPLAFTHPPTFRCSPKQPNYCLTQSEYEDQTILRSRLAAYTTQSDCD